MSRRPSPEKFYTQQELFTIIHNAAQASLNPKIRTLGGSGKDEVSPGIPTARLRKLRELALQNLQIWKELVAEEVIRPEEVVAVMLACGLMAQVLLVQKKGLQGDYIQIGGQKISLKKSWQEELPIGLTEEEDVEVKKKIGKKWDRLRKEGFKGEKLLEAADVFDS